MAKNGTIIGQPWVEFDHVCLSVAVVEDNGETIEYIGRVPTSQLNGKTKADQKAALVAAVKLARDSQQISVAPITGIGGSVTL